MLTREGVKLATTVQGPGIEENEQVFHLYRIFSMLQVKIEGKKCTYYYQIAEQRHIQAQRNVRTSLWLTDVREPNFL